MKKLKCMPQNFLNTVREKPSCIKRLNKVFAYSDGGIKIITVFVWNMVLSTEEQIQGNGLK